MEKLFSLTRALVARKRKIFALFFALAASVGLSWAGVAVDGRLPGEFSIAKNKKVYFSQGNLQYNKSTKQWSFMTNQYDMVETDMQEVGTNYANQNIVSYFCWGNGNNPTGTSESNKQKFTDYGINPISNGGNVANIWRTLSEAEWVYMLNQYERSDYRQGTRFAKAKLFGTTYGLIVFPDNYAHPSGVAAVSGINKTDGTSWNANQYNAADWAKMEAAGCVFLPAAGIRWGTMIRYVGTEANYWTSTPVDNTYAKYEVFTQNVFRSVSKEDRNGYGMSVRLVLDKAYYKVTYKCTDKTSGTVPSDATSYLKGSSVTVKGAGDLAKTGYIFAGWTNGSTTYTGGQTFNILANTTLTAKWNLDMGPVNNVIALINAIGTVTYPGSGDKITAAREAYDALTVQAQKDAVANYATLTDAEAAYLALQPDVVAGKIDAIGEVTYTAECKAKIDEARAAYNALPPATQAQVGNYAKLQAAEATYAQLLAQAVKAVKDQIDALPATPLTDATKKLSEYNKVKAARAAYNALSDAEKAAVSNYDKLTAAEAAFAAIDGGGTTGALSGKFTVEDGKVVYFSKGNLQLIAANTWKFADNQWDYFGTGQSDNHRDLFGWGAINETQNTDHAAYTWNEWGENTDLVAALGTGWRTLTKDEWNELFFTRSGATVNGTADARFAKATINTDGTAVTGVILFPDDYDGSTPAGVTWGDINATDDYYSTSCTEAGWDALEALNCVFLPVLGERWGTAVSRVGERCAYWSSTASDENNAYNLRIEGTKLLLSDDFRAIGDAVRLVTETASASSPIADAQAAKALIDAIPDPVVYPDSKEAIKAARAALDALSDEAKSLFEEADTIALPAAETAYAGLLAEKVAPVIAAIEAVPATPLTPENTKLSEYNKVKAAREAYNALSDEEKAAVTNYDKLEAAEAAFAAISGGGGSAPAGALNGAFSINADGDQILFSKGNLQYQASTTTLRFATNQYDMIGADNANISDTYTGWIDLFGWGTGNHPAYSSTVDEDYSTFTDWGTNAISNGGNEANLWRTMTVYEWNYLQGTRANADNLKGQATVADVHGYVFLPDSWTLPAGLSFTASPNNWTTNVYTAEQWTQMEAAGAVFLPATGYREPEIEGVGEKGWYWLSTPLNDIVAHDFEFNETTSRVFGSRKYFGQPVRLVAEAPASPLADAQAAKDLIDAIPQPVVYTPECKEAIKAAREALDALSDEAKALFNEADTAALPAAEAAYADLLAEKVAPVIAAIDAVPATPLTDATAKLSEYNKVTDARALYDALATDEEKAAVTNYDKLTAAEAAFAAIGGGGTPAGALNGAFTINEEGDQIAFSKGNLQATTADLGANWTWSFAANQWNTIGNAVANTAISGNGTVSENGTVDLFGWSTTTNYYGINNSTDEYDYSGDFVDWGATMGAGWRTLTSDEWKHLLSNRTMQSSAIRYVNSTVNNIKGLIILPDDWDESYYTLTIGYFGENIISAADWTDKLEAHGAVFLPVTGFRRETSWNPDEGGYYSTPTLSTSYSGFTENMNFDGSSWTTSGDMSVSDGLAVRLVTVAATASPLNEAQAAKDLIDAIPQPVVYTPECKEAIKAAREALDALSDEVKALFNEADTAALPAAEATYADLLAEKVAPVIAAIDAVPATPLTPENTKLSEYNKVTDARALYDALATDEEKAAVTNYDKLTAAEAAFAPYAGSGDAGALKGEFSVADGKVVYFSKGNLQASTTDLGANWTWAFAANQWDYVGNAAANTMINGNGTVSTNGTVDLFGWSTSTTFYGIHNSTDNGTYYASFVDWSSNTDLIASLGEDWRTLTSGEWTYLLNTRTTTSGVRYAKATVNSVAGLIILPDNWNEAYHALASTNNPDVDFNGNEISSAEWASDFQAHGAVFLPAAGLRNGTNVSEAGSAGYYWSATSEDAYTAYYMYINDSELSASSFNLLHYGRSVRLVTETAQASPLADAQAVKDLIDAIPSPVVYTPECKEAIKAAREALDALSDEAKTLFAEADTAALPAAETAYADLLAQKVAPVIAAIDAIPSPIEDNLKLSAYDKVTDARALYDALTDEEKAAVTNYDKLEAAEAAFAAVGGGEAGLNVSTEDIGKVLCADGSLYATKDEATAASKTPVAMIAYVEDSKGLAIALEDESDRKIWSTAITTAAAHTPAVTGGTWKLPSLLEWQQMFVGCGADLTPSETSGNVTDYIGLRDKLLAAGGNGFVEWSYWTTTEWADNPAEYAWDPYFSFSPELVKWYKNKKTRDDFYIRAILAFNVTAGASPLADAQAVKDLIDAIPQPVVYTPECGAAIKAAREALDALSDEAKALFNEADTAALPAAEVAYADLLAEKVAPVIAAIDAVPATPLTPENTKLSEYNKVKAAREAYDALSDEEKAAVDNYEKLTAAEAAFAPYSGGISSDYANDFSTESLQNEFVIIDANKDGRTWVPIKDNGEMRYNFGQIPADDWLVSPMIKLKAGNVYKVSLQTHAKGYSFPERLEVKAAKEATAAGADTVALLAAGKEVIAATTVSTPGYILLANDAFTVEETGNYNFGIHAISDADVYWLFVDDFEVELVSGNPSSLLDEAQAALDKINAIPSPVVVSDECNAAIKAAREAVDALGENASLLDDADIAKLTQAEADFAELIKDATAVVAKIDAIGEVTFSPECKAKIVDAREAYDALPDELKPYVSNLATLTAAEGAYEAARPFAPVTTVPAAVEALQYTGAAQALITAGAAEHGTVLYSLDGENYSTELPTALLAGTYTVYYKVQATDDYKDVAPATFTATIAYNYPDTYSLFGIPEGWRVKVNGTEATVENGAIKNIAKDDKFDVLPTKPEDVKLVEVVPYILDLATATDSVIYLMNGDSITGTANGHITVVIVPDAKVYFKDVNLTNTGSHPAVLCGGNAEIVVVGENSITCTKEGEYGIRAAGAGTTLTISGDKTLLSATIDPNGGTVE